MLAARRPACASAAALRSREREVQPRRDAALEHVEVLGQREHRLDHVQVVHPRRVDRREGLGQEIGLLLVVALEADAVAGLDHRFQQRPRLGGWDQLGAGQMGGALQARIPVTGLAVPCIGTFSPSGFCLTVYTHSGVLGSQDTYLS